MSQQELLRTVIAQLHDLSIPYMLTGSLVSSIQGEPRSTHDIDLIIVLEQHQVEKLVHAFSSPDYYLSRDAIADALRTRTMFNLLSLAQGEKVDFWMLTDEPFDRSRFGRRRTENIGATPVMVSSPEDTILAKLKWAKMSGGSDKQFTDSLRVFEVQRANLDMGYLGHWAAALGVSDLWQKLLDTAQPL